MGYTTLGLRIRMNSIVIQAYQVHLLSLCLRHCHRLLVQLLLRVDTGRLTL